MYLDINFKVGLRTLDLKSNLEKDPLPRPRPVTYNERSGHCLPPERNLLQYYVTETENFASINNMKINKKKTKIIKFTNARSLDFPPELTFVDGSSLDTMTETCLLGVVISHDLKWAKNTAYICNKARRKLWILRRMQFLDLTKQELFDVYQKEVRSILEYAVPVWHSSLTRKQVSEIESVQKIAFKMILGQSYSGYTDACATLNTETLEKRRLDICLRFAKENIWYKNIDVTK